jgi:hypothetical protein
VLKASTHNHTEDDAKIARVDFVHEVKRAVRADPTKPIKRAYNEIMHRQPVPDSDEDDFVPEFHSVRSSLARKKQNQFPPIPRRVTDLVIRGRWMQNWQGQQLVCHQDNQKGLVIFMSSRNASNLQRCHDLYVDGTFKVCPKPFYQVITIHGMLCGRVLPFAMVLLKNKTTALYREMFQQLKLQVLRFTGIPLRPRRMLCDFEVGLLTSIEQEFNQVALSGL